MDFSMKMSGQSSLARESSELDVSGFFYYGGSAEGMNMPSMGR